MVSREYGFPAEATGLVLALTGFDEFAVGFPEQAPRPAGHLADSSRRALVAGEHLICLVQTGDPRFSLPPVGGTPPIWNEAEWLNAARGL